MKKSFIIHKDSLDVLDDLTPEQRGELFMAIKSYHLDEEITLSPIVKIAFSPFKAQFARDHEKYEKASEKNKLNGAKGGRPPKPVEPNKPSGLNGNPKSPPKGGSDSDSDSKKDSDNNILIPMGINEHAWCEWLTYRRSKRKKVSKAAAAKQFKLLLKYGEADQQAIINQSIQNDYQGLFELKGQGNGQTNGQQRPNQPSGTKLTPAQKTRLARERWEAEQRGDVQAMGGDAGSLRAPVEQPVRGGANRDMGEVLDGDFTRSD